MRGSLLFRRKRSAKRHLHVSPHELKKGRESGLLVCAE